VILIAIFLILIKLRNNKLASLNNNLQLVNKTLEIQQHEILGQNEEIKQINEEITSQKEALEYSNVEINKQKERIEKAYKDVQILSEFGQQLTSRLNVLDISLMMYDHIRTMMHIFAFGLGIYKQNSKLIEYQLFVEDGEFKPHFTNHIDEASSLSAWSIRNNKEIIMGNFSEEYTNYLPSLNTTRTSKTPQSVVYIPLRLESKLIGVFTVQSTLKHVFTDHDLNNLRTLASYVAIALDNSNAYEIIHSQNEHVMASINYAKQIQHAILPLSSSIDNYFDNFILYRPRDVVSGDFYWMSGPTSHVGILDQSTYIAVIDCSGHGVPGAFMSLIGNRLLNSIVNEMHISKPSEILELLHKQTVAVLRQSVSNNNDGMDLAICKIEPKNGGYNLEFAGAKNALYFAGPTDEELTIIKGTRRSIGGAVHRNLIPFEQHKLRMEKGTTLYMSTDGIIDQHNVSRERYGSKRFGQLLTSIHTLGLSEQKIKIEQSINEYQHNTEQRDDITVLAIRLR
jgi:serine phosphatase RsbU (regulator of sigma subunit)/predicted Holliday junction resolvase-like endonuclease